MNPTCTNLLRLAKAEKSRAVKRTHEGNVHHFADVYRKDKRVLRVGMESAGDVLDLVHNAVPALVADRIVLAVDSWRSTNQVNPVTGKRWELGDMDRIAKRDLGVHRGLLSESIEILGFDRDGTMDFAELGYRHDRDARTIEWSEPAPFDAGGGRFVDVVRGAFALPTVLDQIDEEVGAPPPGYDMDVLLRKIAVSWILLLPEDYRIIESPKGPPLKGLDTKEAWAR